MGRKLRGGSDIQTRNGNLIIADLVGSTRRVRLLGTTTGNAGPRRQSRGAQEDGIDRRSWTNQTVEGRSGAPQCLQSKGWTKYVQEVDQGSPENEQDTYYIGNPAR
jgi:hypothetical protein